VPAPPPVPDAALDAADPDALATARRDLALVYVGNQYERDEQFGQFLAPAAACFPHRVAGKWPRTSQWPHLNFTGRCAFDEIQAIYRSGLATVLLLPDRYARVGHMTQRLFEATLAGCLPLTPAPIAAAAPFTPERLHVRDGQQVIERITWARRIAGTAEHAELIADCLAQLEPFRLSTWTSGLISAQDYHRRKVLPEELDARVIAAWRQSGISAPLFRKTSCGVSAAHQIADYNGHWGVRELCEPSFSSFRWHGEQIQQGSHRRGADDLSLRDHGRCFGERYPLNPGGLEGVCGTADPGGALGDE
jgi:hypothetical protein